MKGSVFVRSTLSCFSRRLYHVPSRRFFSRGSFFKRLFTGASASSDPTAIEGSPYNQVNSQLTHKLEFRDTTKTPTLPVFQVLNSDGKLMLPSAAGSDAKSELDSLYSMTDLCDATVKRMYEKILAVKVADEIFFKLARVGKICFYMKSLNEEGCQIGSAAALNPNDTIFFQYRELGIFLWRGYTFEQAAHCNYGNALSNHQGRQMPLHYGDKEKNCVTISSTLGSKMPQAAGAGYALKRSNECAGIAQSDLSRPLAVTYFGDGCASEGDAHAAMNLAATREAPVLFLCRNNGWAISTPTKDQYRGDGIGAFAHSYGMPVVRCDGHDTFACYMATKEARRIALTESRPVLVEYISYRGHHHSTSDDSSRYRDSEEVDFYNTVLCPLKRMRNFLTNNGLMTETEEKQMTERLTEEMHAAVDKADATPFPAWEVGMEQVYDSMTPAQTEAIEDMRRHLEQLPPDGLEFYNLDIHEKREA